jgi:polyisoprenoid-binding protein YceI
MTCNISVRTVTWLSVISGALLSTNGCGRSSATSSDASAATSISITDQAKPTKLAAVPSTNPSTSQYVSSIDAGQAIVSGTSTLHDWSVKSIIIQGNANFSAPWKLDSASTIALQSINLVIPVDSLKSTEGAGMDNTMYDALKLKQFPTITYTLTKTTLKSAPSKHDSAYHFDTTGSLTVAGAAHDENLDLAVLPNNDGQLTITTDIGLKMTDFAVKPPTAMMGVIKSGDAITIKVNWQLTTRPPTATATK